MGGCGLVAIFVTKSGAGGAGERSSTTENHGPLWALLKSEVRVFCVSWPQLAHSATHVCFMYRLFSHLWADKHTKVAETS